MIYTEKTGLGMIKSLAFFVYLFNFFLFCVDYLRIFSLPLSKYKDINDFDLKEKLVLCFHDMIKKIMNKEKS